MKIKELIYSGSLYVRKRNPKWTPDMEEVDDGQASEFIFEKISKKELFSKIETSRNDCCGVTKLNSCICEQGKI